MRFINAYRDFREYAKREELTANEVVLFLALFEVANRRYWPAEPMAISNNELLAETTFYGSKRDDTLRRTRESLQEHGLITYEKGVAYKSKATYIIHYELFTHDGTEDAPQDAPQDTTQDTPKDTPKKRTISGGYISKDKDEDQDQEPEENEHTQSHTAAGVDARAREDDAQPCGETCGYVTKDNAWMYSDVVRRSIAGRILQGAVLKHAFPGLSDDFDITGCHLHSALVIAMQNHVHPQQLERIVQDSEYAYEAECRVMRHTMNIGGIVPEKWRNME